MKQKEIKKLRNKGITLIALVITIIVLLILAGVSIAMLSGDNGILKQATNAKEMTEKNEDIEKIKLAITEAQIGENGYEELNFHNFQKALNNQFGEDNAIVYINEDGTYDVDCLNSLKSYEVNENNIYQTIDWKEKMEKAVAREGQADKSVIGIGTDGNVVNMDLWEYTFDSETGGYALNKASVLSKTEKTAGYRGTVKEDGTIEGTIPQYIKVENEDWKSVTSLYRTFQGDDSTNGELKKLTTTPKIPPTVKSMRMTFEYCESIVNTTCIPGSVKELMYTFDGYTALEEMPEIGYGVKDMSGAFSGCSKLKKLAVIPDTVNNLKQTFQACAIEKMPNIPSGVIDMNQTFFICTSLGKIEITIPENVRDIRQTFSGCSNLEGEITVNCNPEEYYNFLQNTTKPITLKGNSTMLNQIREGRSNVTVIDE